MHKSSLACMAQFVATFLAHRAHESLVIVDHGSADVNGTYKHLLTSPTWQYIGCDLDEGPNVDVVLAEPYGPLPFADDSVDVLVSGQVLEHVAFPWVVMTEYARVVRPGGLVCIIVPGSGPEHSYPIDCYRYLPEGLTALAMWGGLSVVDVAQSDDVAWGDGSEDWRDTMVVAQKQAGPSHNAADVDRARAQQLSREPLQRERSLVRPASGSSSTV